MDNILFFGGFFAVIAFLTMYYYYLQDQKGYSPFQLGRMILMAIGIILMEFSTNVDTWFYVILAFALFILVLWLNIKQAGKLHGTIMTLWQAILCLLVILIYIMTVIEKNSRVPKKKDDSKSK